MRVRSSFLFGRRVYGAGCGIDPMKISGLFFFILAKFLFILYTGFQDFRTERTLSERRALI